MLRRGAPVSRRTSPLTALDGAPDRATDAAFAERLRRLRAARGWTQAELSNQSGVAKRSIEDYERGLLPRRAIPELAQSLGVSAQYLATGVETLDERISALVNRQARLELRMSQLEEVLASGVDAQRRIWMSLDATLRLLLTQVASDEVLAQLGDPPGGDTGEEGS